MTPGNLPWQPVESIFNVQEATSLSGDSLHDFIHEPEKLPKMSSKDGHESPLSREEERDNRERSMKYHVYVRLPFKRGDFVDPPPVDWDESKSEALWAFISSAGQTEIDWNEVAAQFNVTVEFILQMASYLTERHASKLRAQMRRVTTTKGSTAPSPVPGAEPASIFAAQGALASAASEAMKRTGSGGGRAPSALSIRRDSPLPKNDGSTPSTPIKSSLALRPQASRNPSAGHVPTNQAAGGRAGAGARLADSTRRRLSSLTITTTTTPEDAAPPEDADIDNPSPGPASSADDDDDDDSDSPVESRIIRRPPRFQPNDGAGSFADDDEDEAEPAFLPFSPGQSTGSGQTAAQDLGATLRGDSRTFARRLAAKEPTQHSQTSDSSASSAALVSKHGTFEERKPGLGADPLSPRRTAELAGKGKGKVYARDGSDGTPSMGSSFSDLDDASVTQSAMEEALASKMQDGTIGSRMSTIGAVGAALRSRYLPQNKERQQK